MRYTLHFEDVTGLVVKHTLRMAVSPDALDAPLTHHQALSLARLIAVKDESDLDVPFTPLRETAIGNHSERLVLFLAKADYPLRRFKTRSLYQIAIPAPIGELVSWAMGRAAELPEPLVTWTDSVLPLLRTPANEPLVSTVRGTITNKTRWPDSRPTPG